MAKKIKPPFELLICIVDKGKGQKVTELLNLNNIEYAIQLMGKGTVAGGIADLFGFGVVDKDVVLSLVESQKSSAIVEIVYTDIELNIKDTGVVFTVQPSSAASNVLNFIGVDYGKDKLRRSKKSK